MSQFVENERILKLSVSEDEGSGFDSSDDDSMAEGAGGGAFWTMRLIGNKACVQHLPWLTQELQNPQSPSLHWLHFQKQSFVRE